MLMHANYTMNQSEDAKTPPRSPQRDEHSPFNGANVEADADANVPQAAVDEAAQEELAEKLRREREARAQALTLEIVGDLPFAEVKPPENVLFVCKLNPVTEGQAHSDLSAKNDALTEIFSQTKILT